MVFDSKLKINLYREHFLILWKNIHVFLSLFSFSVLVMYVSMERLYAAKFAAAFFPSSLLAVLHSMNRFLFKRFKFNSMLGHVRLSTTCAFLVFRKAKTF